MLNSLSARWQALKTKYKRIIPFVLTFIFCLSPLSVSAATTKQIDFVCEIHNYENNPPDIEYGSGAVLLTSNTSTRPELVFDVLIPYRTLQGVDENGYYVFNFVPHSQVAGDLRVEVQYYDTSNQLIGTGYSNRSANDIANNSYFVYMNSQPVLGVGNSYNIARSRIRIIWPEGISRFETCMFSISVIYVDENGVANDILSAINVQTDYIVNGNSSTGGIVAGADSSKSELESIVSDYQEIENSMLDNFTLYQNDILSDLNGWSWGGLSLCANWIGDTMTSYFQNMGDFKQYIIYPLLLGIALFFIGRGSAIIGHLFRKPTETYTFSERSSSTKYVNGQRIITSVTKSNKDGGVLRK